MIAEVLLQADLHVELEQHVNLIQQLTTQLREKDERRRQREEELQRKDEELQQRNSEISRLQIENQRLYVSITIILYLILEIIIL